MATDVLKGKDGLTDLQKQNWDLIVATGEKYGFSKEFINLALGEAWAESRLGELAGENGLFQYLPGQSNMWSDLIQGTSSIARPVNTYLKGWGFDLAGNPLALVRTSSRDQTIMFFAEAAVLTNRFLAGTPSAEYNAAISRLQNLAPECVPTSSYQQQSLYIYSTHHSPYQASNKISEVTNAWITKLRPSLMKSLWYLKNPTGLLGNNDLDAMTWASALAEQVIPISSIWTADESGGVSPNGEGRFYILAKVQTILTEEGVDRLISAVPVKGESVTINFTGGASYTVYANGTCTYQNVEDPTAGLVTNYVTLCNTIPTTVTQSGSLNPDDAANDARSGILFSDGVSLITSGVGTDVNTDGWIDALANNLITDFYRPGNFTEAERSPISELPLFSDQAFNDLLTGGINNATQGLITLTPTDPLVLDLNGDGVKLTDFATNPVLFDADHDGAYEQTGWASPEDGILVMDLKKDSGVKSCIITLPLLNCFYGTSSSY